MDIAVVILNWNTEGYLRSFLPALLESLPEGAQAVVADNGSTDGSVALMESEFPQVRRILLDRNYGFTGGYNRAVAELLKGTDAPRYVLLLNSDILVSKGWLKPLTDWMDSHPECGACGPKLHALDIDADLTADASIPATTSSGNAEAPAKCKNQQTPGLTQVHEESSDASTTENKASRSVNYIKTDRFEYAGAAGGFLDRFGYPYCRGRVLKRTETDCGQYDEPKDVLWVSGACLLVRSSVWQSLGGLDDRFFAHMEEIDLCWRMQLSGWKVTVVPESTVWHLGGGSLPKDSPWKLQRNYCNNLLMLENNLAATLYAENFPRTSQSGQKAAADAENADQESLNAAKTAGGQEKPAAALQDAAGAESGESRSNNIAITGRASQAGNPERQWSKCVRKARTLIFFRMLLDGASAVVYCLQGHFDFAGAVVSGHKEYREKRKLSAGSVTSQSLYSPDSLQSGFSAEEEECSPRQAQAMGTSGAQVPHSVTGYTRLFLLPAAFAKGRGIFKYLTEHQDYK